jgi:ATP-binding cassette, subfamily C, bacterial CydC
MKIVLRLLRFLKPFVEEVMLSILLGVATIVAGIGLLGTSAYLISSAALHPSIAELQVAIVGVRFFGISRAAFRYGERLVSHSVNLRLVSSLRSWFFEQLERNDQKKNAVYRSGDLLDRVLHNLETLEEFYVRVVSPFIIFAVITTGVCLFVGHYQARLGWVLAAGLLTTGLILPISSILVSRNPSRLVTRQYSTLSAAVVESLDGLEEITAFGSNRIVMKRNITLTRTVSHTKNGIFLLSGINSGLSVLVSSLTVLGLIWFSIPLIQDGFLTGILLAVVVQIGMASFEATNTLPAAAQQLTQSIEAGKNLLEISAGDKQDQTQAVRNHLENPGNLQVKHVSYYADQGEFSLQDITFDLPKGKKIALVGASGAGKSTLVELMLKFIKPNEGSLVIDETDISDFGDELVRNQFGVMGQGDYLFNCNLRDNLLLAKAEVLDEQLMDYLKKVGLMNWFINLPQGFNTWLGNHGNSISGGEYQRLMLARLIMQKRPFVILDEPLVNLDIAIKRDLLKIVLKEMPSSGLLWITHEYLFMEKMDEILYMENGKIVERGTHYTLMQKKGKYAAAYLLQGF